MKLNEITKWEHWRTRKYIGRRINDDGGVEDDDDGSCGDVAGDVGGAGGDDDDLSTLIRYIFCPCNWSVSKEKQKTIMAEAGQILYKRIPNLSAAEHQ